MITIIRVLYQCHIDFCMKVNQLKYFRKTNDKLVMEMGSFDNVTRN